MMGMKEKWDKLLPFQQNLLTLVIGVFVVTVVSNLITGKSIWYNLDFVVALIVMYGAWIFLARFIRTNGQRFILSFVVIWVIWSIVSLFDGSYVDYTTFIVLGFVSAFFAAMLMFGARLVEKQYAEEKKDSDDE